MLEWVTIWRNQLAAIRKLMLSTMINSAMPLVGFGAAAAAVWSTCLRGLHFGESTKASGETGDTIKKIK